MAKRNDINKLFKQRLTDRQTKTRQKTESPIKKDKKTNQRYINNKSLNNPPSGSTDSTRLASKAATKREKASESFRRISTFFCLGGGVVFGGYFSSFPKYHALKLIILYSCKTKNYFVMIAVQRILCYDLNCNFNFDAFGENRK